MTPNYNECLHGQSLHFCLEVYLLSPTATTQKWLLTPQKWLLTPLPSLAYHFHCSGILVKVFAFHLITCVSRVSVPTHFLCEIDYSLLGVVRCVCKCPVVAYTYVLQPKDPLT